MDNENKTIHEFDFNLICDYFANLDRQGPGSEEITIKALSFIEGLGKDSVIADIGCGTGGQTITLANHVSGNLTGIDLFPRFIEIFNENIFTLGLQDRVKGVVGSMDNLPFTEESLDLIWSEGAIYNIGFSKGLKYWRSFLKKGGYLAVSEASWFTQERPEEIDSFWNSAYPEIDTIPHKVAIMQESGYVPVATFIIPEHCWTDNFYIPQSLIQPSFLEKHLGNKDVELFIANERHEAELYDKYKDFYGYVFYIGKKY